MDNCVVVNTTFKHIPSGHSVSAILSWFSEDPFSVNLSMTTRWQAVDWLIARDVLIDGLSAPSGLGDVSVSPDLSDAKRLDLVLSSDDGCARFSLSRRTMVVFLNKIARLIPVGSETMPIEWFESICDS